MEECLDIELALIEWMKGKLGIEAFADVPNHRPDEFVTVERTGGGRSDVIVDNPMIAVQCWAETRYRASRLATSVDSALNEFAYEPGILKVDRVSMHNFPDEKGSNARYQLVIELKTTN